MKKLLITVIGAAAALGASAGLISTQRFENASVNTISIATLNTLAGGTYWSGDEQTNKYTVTTAGLIACPRQSLFGVAPSNALKIETTFGKPLNVNAVAGGDSTNINSSVFFDSLVKFTVCDSAPTQEYADAKIVMWLQETEADGQVQAKTNLMVKAGYLYVEGGVLTSRDKDYTCDLPQNFDCDAWHRVTIKAIANITKSQTPVPGFAIHIDGDDVTGTSTIVLSDDDKWDESFTQKYEFADAVRNLTRDNALFPSIDQTSGDKVALRSVGFDGTGSITDLIFTEDAPSFAEDYVPSEPVVVIDGQEYTSLEVAVQAINASATAATFKLASDLSLAAPIEFTNQTAAITLDFAGHVITNTLSDAIITNNAVNLIITNSTETVGGIKCNVEKARAIYQANTGTLAITAGNFWGDLAGDLGKITISGGAFKQESMDLEEVVLAEGKAISEAQNADGLYPVIDAITVTYTVTFVYGKPDGSYTQQFQVVENVTPTAPDAETVAVDGWTFNGWDTTVVAATADATYTAQYTLASWVGLLGQPVNGAYVIKNLDDLVLFKNGVAQLGTSGETFRLAADIDAGSLGYWDGIGTASGTIDSSATSKKGLNNCTFDGAGHTISNVKFTNAKYRGFFNQVLNSTIKDLTINVVDIAQPASASSEHGYSAFAGNMKNSKIQSCTATGTIGTVAKPAMHTCGGFAVKSDGGNVFENCTNYVDIVCSLTDNPKIGGIFGLGQTGSSALTNCWNFGDITITCKTCDAAANGAGGLVGYTQADLTISGGGNTGTVQSTDTTAATGTAAVKAGAIIGMQLDNDKTSDVEMTTVSGDTVAQADAVSAGAIANINGLSFATVAGNVATFVADNALAAGNTYKVMATGATATYAFTAAGTISFDTALATPTYAITAAEGLTLTDDTVGTVKTYTAAAPAADWDPNPDEIAENETAAQAYPALGDTPLASANAKKLTKWAKANSVTFETASEATTATVEAFLLNCAPADVETAKEAFKLDITIENGVPQVSLPEGAAYNVEPKMKGSNNLSTWTDTETTAGYQFFKYVLEL